MKKFYLFIAFVSLLAIGCNKETEKHSEVSNSTIRESSSEINVDSLNENSEDAIQETDELPKELDRFVPREYSAYDFLNGDINGDGLSDYILTLKKNESGEDEKLLVQLIIRQKDKSLKLHSSNNQMLDHEEGVSYYEDEILIDPKGKGFTVSYSSSGSGATGSSSDLELAFQFNKKANNWFLVEEVEESAFNSPAAAVGSELERIKKENPNLSQSKIDSIKAVLENNYNEETSTVTSSKDIRKITFSKFKKEDYIQ